MIIFRTIKVENFYSIEYLEYNFQNGVHKLTGKNGSGKTTIASAIYQCLYNKNPKSDGTIDSTYNYVTNKPYKITLTFYKDSCEYTVINDRGQNRITLLKDKVEVVARGVKAQLSNIQSLIGLDYSTFVSISYLNQNSISNVFDLTDSRNLVNKFFDLELLKRIDTNLKVERRDNRKQLTFLNAQANQVAKTITALDKYVQEDVAPLEQQKQQKQERLLSVTTGTQHDSLTALHSVLEQCKEDYRKLSTPIIKLKAEHAIYTQQAEQLSTGQCPLCNSTVDGVRTATLQKIKELDKELRDLEKDKLAAKQKLKAIQDKYDTMLNTYNSEVDVLTKGIKLLEQKILVVQEKNLQLTQLQKDKESLYRRKSELTHSIEQVENILIFVESALGVISSGSITKQYIATFTAVLNDNLSTLTDTLDIPFTITVVDINGNLEYMIKKHTYEVMFDSLSSGERTRVSLLVLLSVVKTLEILTNVDVNLLMFDELLSVLDDEGVALFKEQLNSYRASKNVMVVIHHNEIEDSYFDTLVRVQKRQNLTYIEVR